MSITTESAVIHPDQLPVELDLSSFLFKTINTNDFIDVHKWIPYFDAIPVDPYIKEGYRFKSIAWYRVKHKLAPANETIDAHIKLVNGLSGMKEEQSEKYLTKSKPAWASGETGYECWQLPQYAMQQSIKYNPVHGDMKREYPPIDIAVTHSEDFHKLLVHYASFFKWKDAIVLVQFQRVDCLVNKIGQPTVEGFHQDGNRHVAMVIVNRNNITDDSGVSEYVLDDNGKKTDKLVLKEALPPGTLVYWNDKRLWHYGSDLKVANAEVNGGRGVRDIILMSAKTPPDNMPIGPVPERFK
ncbi:MAG: 2OG-Fe dioxygenase family protein [Flavisolibacter sp.]